jgi:hypothetical protein
LVKVTDLKKEQDPLRRLADEATKHS